MNIIRAVALAVTLLGGLALAKSQSAAQESSDVVRVGNYCPAGTCWVNGRCIRDCF